MTEPFLTLRSPLPNDQLLKHVFNGKVLIFSNLEPVEDLIGIAKLIIAEVFATPVDNIPDCKMPADDLKRCNFELRRRFDESRFAQNAFKSAIKTAGLDARSTYQDRLILRVSAPDETLRCDPAVTLPAHRDTWGSGFKSQINWWLPIFPLLPENTALLYPKYWSTAVPNDADGWDWRQMKSDPNYPPLPTATEPLSIEDAVPLMLEPGQMAVFAGAHLHATRPNQSNAPRFSADTRTVDPEHERLGIGAPDVDHAPGVKPARPWFRKFKTGEPMPSLSSSLA